LIKNLIVKTAVPLIALILISWGSTGHYKINTAASLSYNAQMSQFTYWTTTLADHASDADIRKNTDPTEAPKHYIDIDSYSEFVLQGKIPQTLDSVILLHGSTFVYNNGILPWATLICFDSLRNCFARHDWSKAVLFASDLGHYVADGHMPLHITENYDGQLSGNSGIHSRYESTMINAYIGQINYAGMDISVIPNVNQYIFSYLYSNYIYVDSVLAADNYAKSVSGGSTTSTAYKTALWGETKGFTIPLFRNASHALTELIYTAWVLAGSPAMVPKVTTASPSSVTTTSASSGGNASADGVAAITERGVCWSANVNPVATGNHTTDGTGTGTFTSSITGLTAGTLYHVRAYATNSAGTAYGSDLQFTTIALPQLTINLTGQPVALSGFTYMVGYGPSASQNYFLSGTALSPAAGYITITGSTGFEVSLNNSTFSSSVTLAYSSAALSNTSIFVRLKQGLAVGNYNSELVSNSGGGATAVNVSCSGVVTSLVLPEPSNAPASFSANNIKLNWTDASGTSLPEGYLIRMSNVSFSAIEAPVDGFPVANSATDLNVPYGMQEAWFINLSPNTIYYFKMYAFAGTGADINYKTNGVVPQLMQKTTP
jgi:hypothetical protein